MKEKIQKNLKIYLAFFYVILQVVCAFLVFRHSLTVKGVLRPTIYLRDFKPYLIGLVLSFGYLYSIKKDMKALYNLCSFFLIMIYTYSFMWLNGSAYGGYKMGIGAYIYIGTFFLFFINFFIRTPEEIETSIRGKKGSGNKMITEPIDIKNEYILADYSSGYDKYIKRKSNLSAIMKKENKDKMQIAIYSKDPIKISIDIKEIKEVTVKKEILESPKKQYTRDQELERGAIQTYIIGYFGAFAASDNLINDIDDYYKLKTTENYNITLKYIENKKEKTLTFETKTNPTEFFKK